MKADNQSAAASKTCNSAVKPGRYAGLAFLSAAAGTTAAISASSGTSEFSGLAITSGLLLGLLPALAAGVALALSVVVSGALMSWLGSGPATRKCVFGFLVALPMIVAVASIVAVARSSARLEQVLRAPLPKSVQGAKVSGFNSFLAARWYAQFSASSNDIIALAHANRLTDSTNLVAWEQTVSDTFLQSSGRTNLLPEWKPARLFSRFIKDSNNPAQSGGWVLLFVDDTGTNVFFHRGFQN